jgi:hypothetical protein
MLDELRLNKFPHYYKLPFIGKRDTNSFVKFKYKFNFTGHSF